MAYTPTVWVNNAAPALSAANLNKLTDEIEAQAAVESISHSLPTWVNGSAPALTEAAPWNEMERVVQLVAVARGLSYTKTTWEAGWIPGRNAFRLNRLEQQVAANSTTGEWWAGISGYTRMPESTGTIKAVSTSAQLRSAITSAVAGDQIQLASGTYGEGESEYYIGTARSTSNPVTIAPAPGAVVTIATAFRLDAASGWRLGNGDYTSFVIDGATTTIPYGVWLRSTTSSVELYGVTIRNVRSTNGGNPSGIFASGTTSNVYLLNIWSHSNGRVGGSVLDHGMYLGGSRYVLCNLLLTANAAFGVQFYSQLTDSVVTHVTAAGNARGGVHSGGTSTGIRAYNSIALNNSTYGFENISSGSYLGDHLISYGNDIANYRSLSPATNCVEVDPLLSAEYVPLAGSPAIGHCNPSYSPPFDLAGGVRGVTASAGAYEGG